MRNPLRSTGWVIKREESGLARFVGTCFCFRKPTFFLTAAHCITTVTVEGLSVSIGIDSTGRGLKVKRVIEHPSADVAILQIDDGTPVFDPFMGETSVYEWGIPVSAFGYPEDTGNSGIVPTPRYFRGNIQRMFNYQSHLRYRYEAAELSFGAPAGLSGGPVSPESDRSMVMGVITENLTSTTYLSTIIEERTDGGSYSEKIHAVINYSIAVRLDPLKAWLDEHIPFPGSVA